MKFATVCSGIGAPEAAWSDMWGPPVFTSEIEAFPSAVLAYHYPDVPNYGDMTKYKEWPDHELDVLVGGTPCQAFSVAGLRRSLEDERGNLTLTFLGIVRRYQPRFTIWENVPGVLNTRDNAFGHLLGGIVGADKVPSPNGDKGQGWGNAGFIFGPERVAAWRVLDAQYFGVPQRRRRVFLIASPREMGFAPCQILFEPESLCGNTPKGGKTGESVTALTSNGVGTCGADDNQAQGGHIIACSEQSRALTSPNTATGRLDPNEQEFVVMAHGQGNAEKAGTLTAQYARQSGQDLQNAENSRSEVRLEGGDGNRTGALNTGGGKPGQGLPCVAIQDGRGMEKGQNGIGINEGGPAYTLDQTGAQAMAFQPKASVSQSMNPSEVCPRQQGGGEVEDGISSALRCNAEHNYQFLRHDIIVRRLTPMECERLQGFPDGYTLIPGKYKFKAEIHQAIVDFLVSHFNMTEQKAISLAGHPDGHRYKALGNSMTVPVLKWIGERIQLWEDLHVRP